MVLLHAQTELELSHLQYVPLSRLHELESLNVEHADCPHISSITIKNENVKKGYYIYFVI